MLWEHVADGRSEGEGTGLAKSKDNRDPVKRTKDIRDAVEKELDFDPLIDAAGITVKNMNGDVALNGAVPSYPQYLQAATAGIVTAVVFAVYTQIENHVLNPVVMSKTVRVSPLFVLVSVLVGASIGGWLGGVFGGFVAALLAIPTAAALQTVIRELWRETAPDSSSPSGNGNLAGWQLLAGLHSITGLRLPGPDLLALAATAPSGLRTPARSGRRRGTVRAGQPR